MILHSGVSQVIRTMCFTVLGLNLFGCSDCFRQGEIKSYLSTNLPLGATREQIAQVLEKTGFFWSYEDTIKRYNTIVRDEQRCGKWRAVEIYIYLDEDRRFDRFEMFESYTMP